MANKSEESLQIAVCNYLRNQYPKAIFTCDIGSGLKLTMGQAVKAKKMRSSRAMPDLMVFEPKAHYHSLFVELKREGTKIYLKNGYDLVSDEHIREQYDMLENLTKLGFSANFAIGFNEAKALIDWYMNLDKI